MAVEKRFRVEIVQVKDDGGYLGGADFYHFEANIIDTSDDSEHWTSGTSFDDAVNAAQYVISEIKAREELEKEKKVLWFD